MPKFTKKTLNNLVKNKGQDYVFNIHMESDNIVFPNEKIINILACKHNLWKYPNNKINYNLFQKLANISNTIMLIDYSGYKLPNFGNTEVIIDVIKNIKIDKNIIPVDNNFKLYCSNHNNYDHIYDILHNTNIKKLEIYGNFEYNRLPELKSIVTALTSDNYCNLLEYLKMYPNVMLHLVIKNKFIDWIQNIDLSKFGDSLYQLDIKLNEKNWQILANLCCNINCKLLITSNDEKINELFLKITNYPVVQ